MFNNYYPPLGPLCFELDQTSNEFIGSGGDRLAKGVAAAAERGDCRPASADFISGAVAEALLLARSPFITEGEACCFPASATILRSRSGPHSVRPPALHGENGGKSEVRPRCIATYRFATRSALR